MVIEKSIARLVEEEITLMLFLEDLLARGLINQSALARELISKIRKESGEKPNPQAVIMAVKRYAHTLKNKKTEERIRRVVANSTINLKSGISDIAVEKTEDLFEILNELAKKVKTRKGETLSVIEGQNEAAIIIDEKYTHDLLKKIPKSSILKIEKSIVDVHLILPKEFWEISGVIYYITKQIAMHNINIIDIVTTPTEFSILVRKEDAGKTFEILNTLIEKSKHSET